jgi:hypothetical protein
LRPFRRSTKLPVSAAMILFCNNGDDQRDSNQAREMIRITNDTDAFSRNSLNNRV